MSKQKNDAVQITGTIKDQLSKKYYKNRKRLCQDMDRIKAKYRVKENSEIYKKG